MLKRVIYWLSFYFYFIRRDIVERVDLVIKVIVGIVSGLVSWMIGSFGIVFTVFLALQAIDFITGLMAGAVNEGLSSPKGKKGLIKKTYIILLLCAVYMIELAILKSNGVITSSISGAFAVMEFVSIVENGGRMGIRIPSILSKLVATLKSKTGEEVSAADKNKETI
jgi:toxin secretion/phage lysis holin